MINHNLHIIYISKLNVHNLSTPSISYNQEQKIHKKLTAIKFYQKSHKSHNKIIYLIKINKWNNPNILKVFLEKKLLLKVKLLISKQKTLPQLLLKDSFVKNKSTIHTKIKLFNINHIDQLIFHISSFLFIYLKSEFKYKFVF